MGVNSGLVELICAALERDPVTARQMNQECSSVLKELSQQGLAHQAHEGPFGGAIITHRSRPEFLIVPIANTPEYLQAIAEHAARQASAAVIDSPETFAADLAEAIESAD